MTFLMMEKQENLNLVVLMFKICSLNCNMILMNTVRETSGQGLQCPDIKKILGVGICGHYYI